MNYFVPVMIGAPDMANKKNFYLNKWLSLIPKGECSLIKFSILSALVSALPNGEGINFSDKNLNKGVYLAHYLAGLIEGDGYISITNQNRVILGITFNIKDRPLAEKLLSILGKGFIANRSGNSIELRFSSKQTLCYIIELINGKFRTPKIDQLHKLIDWMNKTHSMNIKKLPLSDSSILNDS
jgi:hypothetical protein